jgi:hypothetical protein
MAVTVTNNTLARFRAFVEATKVLPPSVDEKTHASEEATLQAFKDLIELATPLLLKDIRQCLVDHRAELDHLACWLIPSGHDLLSVARLAGSEDAYTELIGWMLDPRDHPMEALRCQRALLASLGPGGRKLVEPVDPQTQFDTGTSRPDLVMHFEKLDFVLVVEAKTGSDEHETPDGVMQCRAYPPHVRSKLGLNADYPVRVVYLTPDGEYAEDSDAIPITYLDLVRTFGLALRPDHLPDYLRWSYATIFTHFLACATPESVDVADAIRRVNARASRSKKTLDNGTILRNIGGFGALTRLFQRELTA